MRVVVGKFCQPHSSFIRMEILQGKKVPQTPAQRSIFVPQLKNSEGSR